MKILMLTWEYPPRVVGGIARVVNDLSKRLIKDGHEVTVVTYREGNAPYYELDKGVKVYRVDNFMINPNNFIDWVMQLNFNMVAKTGEIIAKEGKFDVIHAHDWLVAYAAKTLKQAYDMPIVSTIHATEAGRNSGIREANQKYINDTEWMLTYESTEVIVNSNFMKGELQRLFGLPFEKINVVANGVNLTNYSGIDRDYDFRRKYALDNEKIILFMGRLVYEKGVQYLIGAMPKILEHYHDAKLVIAGKGGMINELKQEVYNMGLGDKVYFLFDLIFCLPDIHICVPFYLLKFKNDRGNTPCSHFTCTVFCRFPAIINILCSATGKVNNFTRKRFRYLLHFKNKCGIIHIVRAKDF